MHLINLTSILLIAVNYSFSHFIHIHTIFFPFIVHSVRLWYFVHLGKFIFMCCCCFWWCSIGIVTFLRYFGHIWHCSISNSLIPISNSILKTSNCLQTDTFIIQMFFALKSCMDTYTRLWLRYIERLRQKKKIQRVSEFNLKHEFTVYINSHTLNFIAWNTEAIYCFVISCWPRKISKQN